MGHIKLKSTNEIKTDFKRIRPDKISIPEKSKNVVNQYLNSKNLAQESNFGIFIMLDDKMIAGYDYSNLIGECECGLDFCFDVIQKTK